MAYIGNSLQTAQPNYQIIDDISASFDGSTTTFAIQVGGVTPTPFPVSAQHCMISVGGVIQQPDPTGTDGFLLSGSNIVFSAAPSSGEDFFGVILAGADYINVGASFPDGSEANPSLTFDQDLDTGLYRGGSGTTSVTANGNRIADFGPAAVVFNEDGDNVDFRVEGDTVTNLLEVDASRDTVVIGGDLEPATINSLAYPDAGALSNRNLVINGAMQVAQRGTAAVTTSGAFPVDRFKASYNVTGGAFTAQQSTTAPEGFKNSTKFEVTTAASAGASEVCSYYYAIEGQDMQQADFGLSSAKSLTASFWVRSSLTGTYSVAMRNNDGSRSYIAEYTVSSADTWEKKTVTFPGSTDGTWATDNTVGASLTWDLGSGSNRQGTAGSWLSGTDDFASSNNVNWCNTSSATWYITGVQLEVGAKATPFEHRSYGDELARCQRYYQKSYSQSVVPGSASQQVGATMVYIPATGNTFRYTLRYVTPMRATPSATFYNPETGTAGSGAYEGSGDTNSESITVTFSNENSMLLYNTDMGFTGSFYWQHVLSAEL